MYTIFTILLYLVKFIIPIPKNTTFKLPISENHKLQLEQQLWNIANSLCGKIDDDEFRDYILGFIFYKYLSEKMELYANKILAENGIKYHDINESTEEGQEYQKAIKEVALSSLGYFLKPSELFGD